MWRVRKGSVGSNPTVSAQIFSQKSPDFQGLFAFMERSDCDWQHFGHTRGGSRLIERMRDRIQVVIDKSAQVSSVIASDPRLQTVQASSDHFNAPPTASVGYFTNSQATRLRLLSRRKSLREISPNLGSMHVYIPTDPAGIEFSKDLQAHPRQVGREIADRRSHAADRRSTAPWMTNRFSASTRRNPLSTPSSRSGPRVTNATRVASLNSQNTKQPA